MSLRRVACRCERALHPKHCPIESRRERLCLCYMGRDRWRYSKHIHKIVSGISNGLKNSQMKVFVTVKKSLSLTCTAILSTTHLLRMLGNVADIA